MAGSGTAFAASAWIHCARPIPRRARARQSAVVTTDLPASDVVPATSSADAFPEDAAAWASFITDADDVGLGG